MEWVGSYGGPLAVVPESGLSGWVGASVSLDWDGIEGDYDRACAVEEYTGVIAFGDGSCSYRALIIAGEPLDAVFLPELQAVVQWQYADSEEQILSLVRDRFLTAEWEMGEHLKVAERLILFDAACAGTEIEEEGSEERSLEIALSPGVYRVETANIEHGSAGAVVHRFVSAEE